MIVTYTNKSYRITYDGVSMVENALGNPNLIQVSVIQGCSILVGPNSYGINYLPNGDFQNWEFNGLNTSLARKEEHIIYARLQRTSKEALLLFSVNDYAFDGKISGIEASEESKEYYYIKLGKITNTDADTGATKKREITYDGGYLNTPQGNEEDTSGWTKLFSLTSDNLINALKYFASFTIQGALNIVGRIVFNEKEITGIAREKDNESVINDETIPTTKYLQGKYLEWIREFVFSRDRQDQTKFLMKMLGGIDIGETIESMIAGKGTLITPDGRIQTSRLEVRESMTIQELIFNRVSAQEGDTSFSESGVIESVELLPDGTYNLILRKRHETDFTAFGLHDIVYGSVNDLLSGGGNYYSSWFRILSVDIILNSINVILYPDNEVPGGKNSAPEPLMVITRRGNVVNPKRQSYFFLSSSEGRLVRLNGVTKPILEDYNYASSLGSTPDLKILENLPINKNQDYLYARGAIIQDLIRVDIEGKPVYEEIARGIWSLAVASSDEPYYFEGYNEKKQRNETSTIYHKSNKWQCLDTGTLEEPKWNSTDWAFLEGNGELSAEIQSSMGSGFFYGQVKTELEARFFHGYNDITADVMSDAGTRITWSRDTGYPAEDFSWNAVYGDAKNKISLITEDMGSNWFKNREALFRMEASVPFGVGKYKIIKQEIKATV